MDGWKEGAMDGWTEGWTESFYHVSLFGFLVGSSGGIL